MAFPKVLIISGNGFNCEHETHYAFESCGGTPDIIHMNDVLSRQVTIKSYQILVFIGGFSYGDHLGGGKVAANKFRFRLKEDIAEFIRNDTLIIGICNGFQIIAQMGILPGFDGDYNKQLFTLAPNDSSRYEDRWVHLKINPESPCVFTQNLKTLFLPVRHGEGKISSSDRSVLKRILESNQGVAFYMDPSTGSATDKYPLNPNGSEAALAGICDETGRIFGFMPHSEAYLSPYNHPYWTRLQVQNAMPAEGDGVKIFRNAVNYFE